MSLFILSSLAQAVPANLKLLHGYTTSLMTKFSMSVSCKILELPFAPQIIKRNISLHARLNLMLNTAMFLGLALAERWSMSFPELLLNDTKRSVNFRAFLQSNGCHRISDKIDVTSLTVQIANDCLADIELVEKILQPTVDAAWSHGLAECQVKHFFPWNDSEFQKHFPHGITMSVLDLKTFPNTVLNEILVQLASLKVRYHFMNYRRLAIFGPPSLVINLHLALLPFDIHLPIGPKQGAFTVHVLRSEPHCTQTANDYNHFQVKFGKIGSFQYAPAQILWAEIPSSMCNEDQLDQSNQSSLVQLLKQKVGAVNFSIRWCQVDRSQQKCLCFDIEIKHEDSLPLSLDCDLGQVVIQHQCPSAENFRADVSLTEVETRRDHWNKVIAQQMIPKEGRISHLSFEPNKKQSAKRYYELRTTVIDSMQDFTNIIAIASQPPAWFFSPKELRMPLVECLQKVNFCDNSFIQESFVMNPDIVKIDLLHHEFIKHRDHLKWLFYHIVLGPEQCFHLKSVHLERDEWKVRYYDELIVRTFEPSSIFITLPPGISISQVIDKTQCCHLREAYACSVPSQKTPDVGTTQAGLKEQYTDATPTAHFPNGHGMNSIKRVNSRGHASPTPTSNRPAYRPPYKPRQSRGSPNTPPEGDIEMQPAPTNNNKHPEPPVMHLQASTGEHSEDVPMECVATALDPVDDDTHSSDKELQQHDDTPHGHNSITSDNNLAMTNLDQNHPLEPEQHAHDDITNNLGPPKEKHVHHNTGTLANQEDVANVGHSRLCDTSRSTTQTHSVSKTTAQPSLLDCPTQYKDATHRSTHTHLMPQATGSINSPACTANDSTFKQQDHSNNLTSKIGLPTQSSRQTSKQTSRSKDEHKSVPNQPPETILDLLAQKAAYQPLNDNANAHVSGDDVIFIKASHSPIDSILCSSAESSSLLISNREIITGWPSSFSHADCDYFSKLATCYLIKFPSYMCYAVTALRVLTHAPWNDNMFHGHIRELVLCAIGNGWTWADQTATVQGRRVSIGEVCAAFASYLNVNAFPPGQVSDLDTAIIAACDDLFPDHCELFFAQFHVNCLSCNASGKVSAALFDTMLSINLENDTIDLSRMIADRAPRLALDREDVGFSHASDCHNQDQQNNEEIEGCLIFTLKITSPIEQLPIATKALHLLGQLFNVPTLSANPVCQSFLVTGIIIVQGKSSHHFLIIERWNEGQVLVHDNLRGHVWISVEQLKATSFVWGFVFRRHDHQPYSFQPPQYKAIAPATLQCAKQPHRSKKQKLKPKNILGISAKRYQTPNLSKKKVGNNSTPDQSTEALDSKPVDPLPPSENPHPADTPKHTYPAHSEVGDQHGVLVVGYPPGTQSTSPPVQNKPAGTDHPSHHGVPMVGLGLPFPHAGAPIPHADQNNDIVGSTSEIHCGAPTVGLTDTPQNDNGPLFHAELDSKELVDVPHPHEPEALTPVNINASAQCPTLEHAPAETVRSRHNDNHNDVNPSCSYAGSLRPPVSGESEVSHSSFAKEKDASPPKRAKYSKVHPYAIISLFDGVGSAIPAITKAIGCAPRIIVVAECDPILRQLVGEQFGLRTDGEWTQSSKDTYTLYADDVRRLLRNQCRILKEAFALAGPQCRWFLIAGSPCQDLTPAGPLKGLLGLTGHCSSLFYYVHVILWLVQMNYPLEHIRFLLENAGAMLDIHRKAILRALGLNPDSTPDSLRVDPKNTHGIRRNRFYFRNYQDGVKVPKTVVLEPSDIEGPLIDFNGHPIPYGPLLRVRSVLGHNVLQLSWTAYQPISLIWDYLFWGDKAQFQLKAKMHSSDIIPALDFENSLPPHYLRAWNRFLQSLRQKNVSTIDRDRLVRAILPIFHHPHIKAPMRILLCEEVEKLAGLHNHFDRVQAHRSLLTEFTVRNYCGNSFHPEYIQAAVGHPERLRDWLTEPAETATKHAWSGVVHPKQARAQYQALREQVQTLAREQRIRDFSSKQVGLDPMPELPIHALEGLLTPVMPTVLPKQLLPANRKIHPADLGVMDSRPPSQLSPTAIQLLQEQHMQSILVGMRFFGAGIGRTEDLLQFFFGHNYDAVVERHCPQAKEWISNKLKSAGQCTSTMAQLLLWLYSLLHREQVSVHFVHIADWEDQAHIATYGDAPAKWTVYCVQFPRSRTFHLDTAAWNCHTRVDIPWQQLPQPLVFTAAPIPFRCTNPNCIWFAVPYGPKGQYLICHRFIGTFLYDKCIVCFLSRFIEQASCNVHTTASSYPELHGCMFIDNEGNVAVAAAHDWRLDDTAGYQTCLIKASIDNRVFKYPEHINNLPHINPIGKISQELACHWNTDEASPVFAYFICSLIECQ